MSTWIFSSLFKDQNIFFDDHFLFSHNLHVWSNRKEEKDSKLSRTRRNSPLLIHFHWKPQPQIYKQTEGKHQPGCLISGTASLRWKPEIEEAIPGLACQQWGNKSLGQNQTFWRRHLKSLLPTITHRIWWQVLGNRDGAVVRALGFHHCGPGSIPWPVIIHVCGLSLLLVLALAPRGFSLGSSVFPSP